MKKTVQLLLAIVILSAAYFTFWPVPIDPQVWKAPPQTPYEGDYAVNDSLSSFDAMDLGGLHGPEAVITGPDNMLYATTHEGWIIRWSSAQSSEAAEQWVDAGGRPLGIAFDDQANLWVANAYLGLQKITPSGELTLELNEVQGTPIDYADDLDIASDGWIYFSDASTRFGAKAYDSTLGASLLDIMEHSLNGRIIAFQPATGEAKVVMDQLSFANGVALSSDESFMLVAETGGYRVWKHWLQGPSAERSEVIVDALPGFPDNVHLGQDGRFWVGLTSPRSALLDDLADKPFWRKVVQRMPEFIRPNVEIYGHVVAIDSDGNVLANLQDPNEQYAATTGAWETADYLFVSSLTESKLARYNKSDIGL
ncbi:MAG: SMP-30/gluconolactonase/LRE family protein [Pseudomonadota bacterium]